jgi:SNF2 family DNA or RNA helicase
MTHVIPDLIDNGKHRLADVLRALLAQSREPRLDVVAAFFNLRGLEALEPEIERLQALRLLLGKEQEQAFVVGDRLLAELEDAAARGETTAREIRRWRDFLSRDSVAVRRYGKTFLHGKAYIVHGVPALGVIGIVGSSNFTGAGLTTNRELNAVLKQESAVRDLQSWFEALWQEAEDYKAELLELLERFTRIYTPYEIYIKVLYEALRDRLDQELGERDEKPSPIALADFQHDGYLAAREILENYGGVLIADSVGLGKTYLTLRLLEDYAYRERQTALVVCPAAVMDTLWRPLLQQFAIPHEVVSMERVSQRDFPVEEYAQRFRVIVVDESHNFRNPDTNRWVNLFRVVTNGDSDKKVILLTATPVNNTVFDLYYQLSLITRGDDRFLLIAGIPDLREYFRQAEQNREALYEVLEALAVRRSRPFIRNHYPHAEIDGQRIRFPERRLHTVRYSLKATYGADLYRQIAEAIEGLRLAPYQVETYRRELLGLRARRAEPWGLFEDSGESPEDTVRRLQEALRSSEAALRFLMAIGRQRALAQILRVLYLKRLESSVEALRISLQRLRDFLSAFLEALSRGRLLDASSYRRWVQQEGADEADEGESLMLSKEVWESLPSLDTGLYDVDHIRQDVQADLQTLEAVLSRLEQTRTDNKLQTLKELLTSPPLRGKKVVLFSYFKDTARYLYRQLREDKAFLSDLGHARIAIVDSEVKPSERRDRIARFAPRAHRLSGRSPDEPIDLLISTDVLSEGQNLQDASVLINYDLHWNPVRLVQRIGRLDRIGSPHDTIDVYNFFPEEDLEELLGILTRLYEKLHAINRTVGLDASVLGETPNPMDFNILRRLAGEEGTTLDELEEASELTVGEFLKQDLLRFLKEAGEERLRRIPLGVGTARRAREGPRGFFAAFRNPRTGQHHWLFYDEASGRILDRRLEAIRPIRCEPSEPAEPLPEDLDPSERCRELRRRLWERLRANEIALPRLPTPQRQVVAWLRALPPSAERNRLLEYFEARPLAGPDLKELRSIWRKYSRGSLDELFRHLREFAERHPHPPGLASPPSSGPAPLEEEELECIAWVRVV